MARVFSNLTLMENLLSVMEVETRKEVRSLDLARDNHDQRDQWGNEKGHAQEGRDKIVHGGA